MRRNIFLLLVVCLVCVFSGKAQTVNESETRAFITNDKLQTAFIIENQTQNFSGKMRVELLDLNGNILSQTETTANLKAGKQTFPVGVALTENYRNVQYLLWYRLRYSIISMDEKQISGGIIALSEIIPDLFEFRAAASNFLYLGINYIIRVRAFHPIKENPISGIKIKAQLNAYLKSGKNDVLKIESIAETDAEGFATLNFQIPNDAVFVNNWSGSIQINGEKNGVTGSLSQSLSTISDQISMFLNTDKPIYQPGQKFYVRGLALRRGMLDSSTTIATGKELEFIVKDEEETILYREKVKTSEFGIAAIEWQIPDNAKLGTYQIQIKSDENLASDRTTFKISRYELPNFVVNAKAAKEFYLPDENSAEVTIDGTYLFGKPVNSGKVRVVRETNRNWNYKAQKWDSEEEKTYEGETNADGKYIVKVDLNEAQNELKNEDVRDFRDVRFAAYFTDSSTNRTEQRRFDVRVSKKPIHVYLIGNNYGKFNPKMPLRYFVTTFSADGKPVACDVEIKGKYEDETKLKTLAKLKTNALGAGEVEFSAPKRKDDIYVDDLEIEVTARDSEKNSGIHKKEIDIEEDEKNLIIRTDKTIYRKGEPLKIDIISTEKDRTVFLDISKNSSNIKSTSLRLNNGRASISIPYEPNFKSELTISAFFENNGNAVADAETVIYPTPKNLRLDVSSVKTVFRPNEEAKLDFGVFAPDKTAAQSAIGLVVFDRAIEERARTDAEFGGNANIFGGFNSLLGFGGGFGGFSKNDFEELDTTKTIAPEIQLAAAIAFENNNYRPTFFNNYYQKQFQYVFYQYFYQQFFKLNESLQKHHRETFEYPKDEVSMRKLLAENNYNFDEIRDPWGMNYLVKFDIERDAATLSFTSAGTNKVFGDKDDFIAQTLRFQYFLPIGLKLDAAIFEYQKQNKIFIRDEKTLRAALLEKDINLDEVRDYWGENYKVEFGLNQRNYTISFRSGGSDKKFSGNYWEDFVIWTTSSDSFKESETRIEQILNDFIKEKQTFPATDAEFKAILKEKGFDFDLLRDNWNRPFYLKSAGISRFADKIKIESEITPDGKTAETLSVIPVTQKLSIFRVRSLGADGVAGEYWDDFDLSTFGGIISEQSKADAKPKIVIPKAVITNGKSTIFGIISDANGAVIPNASVVLTNLTTKNTAEIKTNSEGMFIKTNLDAGNYSVSAFANGFKTTVITQITVNAERINEIAIKLEVGSTSEVVSVSADSLDSIVNTSDSSIGNNFSARQISELPVNGRSFTSLLRLSPSSRAESRSDGFQVDGASGSENVMIIDGQEITNFRSGVLNENNEVGGDSATAQKRKSTPRLRQYFPETLLWQPEVLTDENGKASVNFRMGDNITTWKIYAIASDKKGKVGIAQKEIQAFQPFFVDLDPPKILTVGDEISLPVQVRNYTKEKQKVDVSMEKSDWFAFLNSADQQIEVNPGSSQNAVFPFRVNLPTDEGLQKVTAIGGSDSDAIEKPVSVHPNGQEISNTQTRLFINQTSCDVNFPANALPNSQKAELKIYPNLFSHVAESVEGLLKRPYGCGEQTISSTYPNLMILKFAKNTKGAISPEIESTARKFLKSGYERLLSYRNPDGGFGYWSKDAADISLTAYALRFLNDADGFVEVDKDVIAGINKFLISRQSTNGSWMQKYSVNEVEDFQRTKMITTYVARVLSMKKAENANDEAALKKAFAYLKEQNASIDEPYALANLALSLQNAGDFEAAETIVGKLKKLAIAEKDTVYWNLETNTPFYGWGTPGRIETTALVVQALIKSKVQNPKSKVEETDELISKGTQFLLKNKDRYGVWHSTQTTINVLDALLASLSGSNFSDDPVESKAEIFVNGQKSKDVALPSPKTLGFPISVDISTFLQPAQNKVEVKINGNSQTMMTQIVANHYISWQDAEINAADTNASRQIKLDYKCDKLNAKIAEEITCSVNAERVGFRGYGMLLAEIGLPPGADVDRASLEKAKNDNWSFSRYDILPDKIIIYMWAYGGGTKFDFKFKPRYGINANTAPSVVYDYYNEEAKATLAPLKFEVK